AEAIVVGLPREREGIERAEVAHEHRDAGRNHERDRDPLPAGVPQVAQQLAVKGAYHHCSALGATFRAGRRSSTMRPSASEMTRSAMAATAELCVMTAVVVPRSLLMRSMASSTMM